MEWKRAAVVGQEWLRRSEGEGEVGLGRKGGMVGMEKESERVRVGRGCFLCSGATGAG